MKNIIKEPKKLIGATLAVVLVMGAVTSTAFAYQGDPDRRGPNYTPERYEAVSHALATRDYSAWSRLMEGKGAARFVNRDNFARFAEIREIALSGDKERAREMRYELMNEMGIENHAWGKQSFRNENRLKAQDGKEYRFMHAAGYNR